MTTSGLSGGEKEYYSINKNDSWGMHASNARSYIKVTLKNFDGTSKNTIFIKFIGKIGYLICLVKARPEGSGRSNDNTASWIYIPSDIEISGEETKQILDEVESAISAPKEINTERLEEVFSKTYIKKDIQKSVMRQLSSKNEGKIAVRFYDDNTEHTLNNLLGNNIAQKEYSKFKAVFFIDKDSGITPNPITTQLLINPITKICTISPPKKDTNGFIPYINNSSNQFSRKIEVLEGNSFNIVWRKEGYSHVTKTYTVNIDDDNKAPSGINLSSDDYKLIVLKSWFNVINSKNQRVKDCTITLNSFPLRLKETPITEKLLKGKVKLEVEKEGYKPYSKEHDNILQNTPITIPLQRIIYHYELTIPIFNQEKEELDEPAKVIIDIKHKIINSPIPGYKLDITPFPRREANILEGNLKYDKNIDKKLRTKCFLNGFIASFIACLIIASSIVLWIKKDDIKQKVKEYKTEKTKKGNERDSERTQERTSAIKYLDENTEWEKEKLNKLYEGLYNSMVNFNLDDLVDTWGEKLSESSRFLEIIEAAELAKNSEWDSTRTKKEIDYLVIDTTINVDKYIEWLKTNSIVLAPPEKSTAKGD